MKQVNALQPRRPCHSDSKSHLAINLSRRAARLFGTSLLPMATAGRRPTTVIAPAMFFDELEGKRADTKDKLPDYPPPPTK
jgi:hypothetical protein